MIIILLAALWLISGTVGTLTWVWIFGRHWERLQSQKRRGENGVLREIALGAIRRDITGTVTSMLILMILAASLAINDSSIRMVISRLLISMLALLIGLIGYQTMHDEERVMNKIRDSLIPPAIEAD